MSKQSVQVQSLSRHFIFFWENSVIEIATCSYDYMTCALWFMSSDTASDREYQLLMVETFNPYIKQVFYM